MRGPPRGLCAALLAGAILVQRETGSLHFGHLGIETPGGQLIFLAFGIKAAFPLLHGWLKDATFQATYVKAAKLERDKAFRAKPKGRRALVVLSKGWSSARSFLLALFEPNWDP